MLVVNSSENIYSPYKGLAKMCKISEIISNVTASVETINNGKNAWTSSKTKPLCVYIVHTSWMF